jgi:SAM-dependent methyltransferase
MSEGNSSAGQGYSLGDWQGHYDSDDLRWDIGEVAPPFVRLWQERKLVPGKAIVPGCGRGHEVVFLAEQGFQVTGVDFAPGAVDLLKCSLSQRNLNATVLNQNFFDLDSSHDQTYDLMLEQTFFCAILPDHRPLYVETVKRILKPGGRLVGLFYETGEEGGPPFNTTEGDIRAHFSGSFKVESLHKTPLSTERRKDKELLGVLIRK